MGNFKHVWMKQQQKNITREDEYQKSYTLYLVWLWILYILIKY